MDRLRARGRLPACRQQRRRQALHESQRHWHAGRAVLERAAAGAGSLGWIRVLRAEPAAPPLRPRPRSAPGHADCRTMAVGEITGADRAPGGTRASHTGAVMTARAFGIDKRYLAPILVTIVLLAGQLTFGFLESWGRTALAITTAIGVELLLARVFTGAWPHLASAYISGIS